MGGPTKMNKPAVILLHGLYLGAYATRLWEHHLQSQGYAAHGFSYASMQNTLSQNAKQLASYIKDIDADTIHCVGHSLGGLLILQMLKDFPDARIRRGVLVGTPYHHAYVPTTLANHAMGRELIGKSMAQWLAQTAVGVPPPIEIGVIAGNRAIGLGRMVAPGLPTPNDGTVAVEETKVPGMRDHITLHVSHTEMLFSQKVMQAMETFLQQGRFAHE
jgi:pimeloyl-ACP methyl ester carboxylesterase